MLQSNIDISELYNNGTISGETYLYCVEQNIVTIQDVLNLTLENASKIVVSELSEISKQYQENIACNNVQKPDNYVSNEMFGKYYSFIHKKYADANGDVKFYLDKLIEHYGNIKALIRQLLILKAKEEIPEYYGVKKPTVNAFMDIVYELQMLGRKYSLFDELFLICKDVRCKNVLKSRYNHFGNKLDFINWILTCDKSSIWELPNIGKRSLPILLDVIEKLRVIAEENRNTPPVFKKEGGHNNLQTDIFSAFDAKTFELFLEFRRDHLSVRANNILNSMLKDSSYEDVLKQLMSPELSFCSLKNCGKKTEKELNRFRTEIISFLTTSSPEEIEHQINFQKYKKTLSLPDEIICNIIKLREDFGYFPLFYVIQQYIDNMPYRDNRILYGMLDIYNGQSLQNQLKVGEKINLTGERVRQLRNKILKQLQDFILSLGIIEDLTHYSPDKIDDINYKEGTNFQDNFIYWTISLCNTEWIIIGDIEDVFFNPHGRQINLNIVPASLVESYDFHAFIAGFNDVYLEKRTVCSELNLQLFCLNFFKNNIRIALLDDIIHECKKIILRLYDCFFRGDIIVMDSNAYRGLPEIAEEIIRENGSPMTAEEIYIVLLQKYPNQKCKSANSLAGNIRNNANVLPMGKSRTFTLKEWDIGTKRGGTIREFAEEYILMQPHRIASLEKIGSYVRQHRKSSTDANIQTNLMAEASGKFVLFTKNNSKYIGLKGNEYDRSYIPTKTSKNTIRSFTTSKKLFKDFIERYGRFPLTQGDEGEKRLRRFWSNTIYKYRKGMASIEEIKFVEYIQDAFPNHDISANEYKWRERHKSICETLTKYGKKALNSNEQMWCYNYLKLLEKGQLKDW